MEDIQDYNDIRAYKSAGVFIVLCVIIGGIGLFACIFFIALTVRVNLLYLIGVVTTGIFGLWSVGLYIKKRAYPDLVLKQQGDSLYLFPETKNQVILLLTDIVELNKKNSSFVLGSGQLMIISKTTCYSLNINDLNTIYKSLDEKIKRFKKAI